MAVGADAVGATSTAAGALAAADTEHAADFPVPASAAALAAIVALPWALSVAVEAIVAANVDPVATEHGLFAGAQAAAAAVSILAGMHCASSVLQGPAAAAPALEAAEQ